MAKKKPTAIFPHERPDTALSAARRLRMPRMTGMITVSNSIYMRLERRSRKPLALRMASP